MMHPQMMPPLSLGGQQQLPPQQMNLSHLNQQQMGGGFVQDMRPQRQPPQQQQQRPQAPPAMENFVDDPKTSLNQFCQRYCSRPVTKADVMYTTTKFGPSQFQAIVKLNCLEGQEYAGELSPNPKYAEKSAADQALQAFAAVIASLAPPVRKNKNTAPLVGMNSHP